MIAIHKSIHGISSLLSAQNGLISCPSAPPNGFAKLITAVAATLPFPENHKSEYLVGAVNTNGCARPHTTCEYIARLGRG